MNAGRIIYMLLYLMITESSTQNCSWSTRTVEPVNSCPKTADETEQSANRKKCFVLANVQKCTKPSNFKYHCLPDHEQSTLLEVCAPEKNISGTCVVYNTEIGELQNNHNTTCNNNTKYCPSTYPSTSSHFYIWCHKWIKEVSNNSRISEATSPQPDDTHYEEIIIFSTLPALLITSIICMTVIAVFLWKRRQRLKRKKKEGQNTSSLPDDDNGEEMRSLIETERFSKLTDDAMSVFFCFLCSDSGPPDFTDTEWLDLLNEIRRRIHCNPVTREEAQQTLEKLKSPDFFREDQDKITDKTKDEIMYWIATKDPDIPFLYGSYDTARVYLRLKGYHRKPGEKCVVSRHSICDSLLIRRLQMNILTHVTMEDKKICDRVHQTLNIADNILKDSEDELGEFLFNLRRDGEAVNYRGRSHDSVDHVTWLWRYGLYARPDIVRSCVGLHPHWDIYIIDNKAYRKTSKMSDNLDAKCLLYSLLFTEKYQLNINEQSHNSTSDKIRDRYCISVKGDVHPPDGITKTQNGVVTFISDDIRHDVMYAFVTECLVEDSDLEFFLTTASRDVISEYCRSWEYMRSEGERCLYVPGKMYDLFIDKLQLDIITHCTMSDMGIHDKIRKYLNIPEEIFSWDLDARKRFIEDSKLERVEMFCARGMVVGCAGAGKTTLLRRLQRKRRGNKNKSTETTVGIEVHEDLFEIENNTLIDASEDNFKMLINGLQSGKKMISMTDFAGQVAYYACHQVYLSRRAFYIIVVDMSKGLDEKVSKHNVDRHNPQGSLFDAWNYRDYFHFWLQSIKTYCDNGNIRTEERDVEEKISFHPVILIASHKDRVSKCLRRKKGSFYGQLEKCLSETQTLKDLISVGRYFEVECPAKIMTNEQEEKLEKVRKCIVETVKQLPHWGEKIPLKWAQLEKLLRLKKTCGVKLIAREKLKTNKDIDLSDDVDLNDALRFFHETGQIIYFSEGKMKYVIIVNVQWFVDGFKYIITDETHLARKDCNSTLNKAGKITGKEIEDAWRKVETENSYIRHKEEILPYLDKLGLMTNIQSKDKDTNDELYYIPSMNRIDLAKEYKYAINTGQKTSIFVFHFKTYLPHFFFFRLVVKCLNKWKALDMEMFCKNAAFYKVDDASHYIVIAVNKTSIQLQVFTPEKEMDLRTECVIEIRETVERMIHDITQTFHRQTKYEIGYSCTHLHITEEDEEFFLTEEDVIALRAETGRRPCPKHIRGKQIHTIDKNEILRFWRKEHYPYSSGDNRQTIDESQV